MDYGIGFVKSPGRVFAKVVRGFNTDPKHYLRRLRVVTMCRLLLLSILQLTTAVPISTSFAAPLWRPIPDTVYLQETGRKIKTEFPLTAVAVYNGQVFLGSDSGLLRLDNDQIAPDPAIPAAIRRLKVAGDSLWALAKDGLYRLETVGWTQVQSGKVTALCEHLGKIHVATPEGVYRLEGEEKVPLVGCRVQDSLIDMASYSETLYFLYPGRLVLFDGKEIEWENVIDWGALPSHACRDMLSLGSRLLIATDRGVATLRGMAMTTLTGKEGLCYEDATCLAPGFADDLWIGTQRGAIRSVGEEYHYFNADRWLPHGEVRAIACGPQVVYIATAGGLGIIEYEPYTLAKKAAYYERHLEEWGQKRLGFVYKLEWDDTLGEWVREVSDNDCGWSTHYLTAMSFKYAVTGDESARAEAVNTFKSLKWAQD
ncbi:MAG: hypothetical protein HUU16_15730, partial [Candidatus Omnitrophica bacterium]|nr:hypothetical protein [Candidatus Omnitrophota bacterium]